MLSITCPTGDRRHICLICIVVLGMTTLMACGGSSNGGSSENTAPVADITAPLDGALYTYGDAVLFSGSGTDAEDGDLVGTSLVWTSDIDDVIGTGTSFTLNDLSRGEHIITLTATDSREETGSASVHVSVKAWNHPADLTDTISLVGRFAYSPQVAMDDNGNAILVWRQSDGERRIFISEYRGGNWIHPTDATDYIGPDGIIPSVAMDNNGNAVIVWSNETDFQLYMSEYRNGAWIHPVDPDYISPVEILTKYPQVAMGGNGDGVVTWEYGADANGRIFISQSHEGVWTHPADLDDCISPIGSVGSPRVAMDDNGDAVVVWQQSDGANLQIFMSEYRDGVWAHPTDLNDNISPDDGRVAAKPQVAMVDNGDAIIVWRQSDGSNLRIFMSEYRDGVWVHPVDLNDTISPDGQSAENPQVAMDDDGNAIIAWQQFDGSNSQIFMSEYRDGIWTHPADFYDSISPDGQSATSPQVAMDNNGSAVIAWVQSNGVIGKVFISEYRRGVWTHPDGLTDSISPDGPDDGYPHGRPSTLPQVAMDNDGNAIITWVQYDGSDYPVFMSEYR